MMRRRRVTYETAAELLLGENMKTRPSSAESASMSHTLGCDAFGTFCCASTTERRMARSPTKRRGPTGKEKGGKGRAKGGRGAKAVSPGGRAVRKLAPKGRGRGALRRISRATATFTHPNHMETTEETTARPMVCRNPPPNHRGRTEKKKGRLPSARHQAHVLLHQGLVVQVASAQSAAQRGGLVDR